MKKERKVPLCPTCGGPCTGNTTDGFATLAPNYEEEIAAWYDRMDFLFRELPFDLRHQWGGDAREMVEGIDWAIARNGAVSFEQQVAAAIMDLYNEWMRLGDQRPTWMRFVAPRVAAALKAEARGMALRHLRGRP